MPISFKEGARRWENVVKNLPGDLMSGLEEFHGSIIRSQLRDLRDAPTEDRWRDSSDSGPLRIVTARLWQSIRGPLSTKTVGLDKGNPPRISGRRYPMQVSGISESIWQSDVTIRPDSITGFLRFGTETPYAAIQEFGGKDPIDGNKIKARPFFYPGIQRRWKYGRKAILPSQVLRKNMRGYLSHYLQGGQSLRN